MESMNQKFETKTIGGHIVEFKEIERDGVRFGIIESLIATWEEDTGGIFGIPDRFERGAFSESIIEHRTRNQRMVRLKDQHGRVVGGFPIETVAETDSGLFAIGEINLETQQGAEMWALIKQGVLVDMSVGFSSREDEIVSGVRVIKKAILWEGSVVDEPANRGANILGFKSTPFADLPIAPMDYVWDQSAARARVDGYVNLGSFELKSAFVQEKDASDESFDLQIADVIEGKLTVIPEALKKVSSQLIDQEGTAELVEHVERYFAKMGVDSPFPEAQRKFFGAAEVREWKAKDIERALIGGVRFSKGAAKVLASRLTSTPSSRYDTKVLERILHDLEEAKRVILESR